MRNRTADKIKVVLVRHGETAGNAEKKYIGRTDENLSPEGVHGLETCRQTAEYCEPDFLYSSPMRRCLETAALLFPHSTPVALAGFTEIDFGLFEGRNWRELNDDPELQPLYQAWIDSNGKMPFPKGESREDFTRRTMEAFFLMMENAVEELSGTESPGKVETPSVTAVVHGGTIMAVLSTLFGGDWYDYHVKNGGGYTFHVACRPSSDGGTQAFSFVPENLQRLP